MSIKSQGRRIGRMVRRVTGLKLPTAMKIGKMIAQGQGDFALMARFPEHVFKEESYCECCGPQTVLKGPKGSVVDYYISERALAKELRIRERLSKVPFGTPVSAE